MKKPVSDRQLAANRANAAQSTGPRSPEGKSRSAPNSRKHGFTASTFAVVRLEDIDEVAHLRDDAIAVYQPVNSQELFAIERIALAQQVLLRVERLHEGIFTTFLNEALTGEPHGHQRRYRQRRSRNHHGPEPQLSHCRRLPPHQQIPVSYTHLTLPTNREV